MAEITEAPFAYMARNCTKETEKALEGSSKGSVPEWLQGSLYRIGPGTLKIGDTEYNHIFDGLALIHQFNISNGMVSYYNHFLRSDTYAKNIAANRIVVSEFGTAAFPDPCKSLLQRFMSFFTESKLPTSTDNCLVTIVPYGDKIYAMSEIKYLREVDPKTLDSPNKVDLENYLTVHHATAHPHVNHDGTVYNIGTWYRKGANYVILEFPVPEKDESGNTVKTPFEQATVVATFPSTWKMNPGYYHSFGMSENYFIFMEQPLVISVTKLLYNGVVNKDFADALNWHPDRKTRFYIIERKTGRVLPTVYLSTVPFFCFHHINAYEEDGHLVIDIAAHKNSSIIDLLKVKNLRKATVDEIAKSLNSVPWRFVLPLEIPEDNKPQDNLVKLTDSKCTAILQSDGSVVCSNELLSDVQLELPRINYKYNGKKYRYHYGTSFIDCKTSKPISRIAKVDTESKSFTEWIWDGCHASEPVFIASPNSSEEDDGVLLLSALRRDNPKAVSFIILDARDLHLISQTDFEVEEPVGIDFHGLFTHHNQQRHSL